ncbi:MAG: hypothetical protein ACE5K4_09995 [Candidatus Hydrothermarchaeota archaeon]
MPMENIKTFQFSNKNFVWISVMIFFAGFFIGYTLRFLDVIHGPMLGFEPIYPIHRETVYAMKSFEGYAYEALGYEFEVEILDILRSNIVPAVAIIGCGVLLAIPSATLLFVIGIASGSSLAEILEFTPLIMNVKVIICLSVFIAAMMFSTSAGFQIGSSVYGMIRKRELKIEKSFYDCLLITSGLVGLGIILQYVLLVM